jgi:hypothetical protein
MGFLFCWAYLLNVVFELKNLFLLHVIGSRNTRFIHVLCKYPAGNHPMEIKNRQHAKPEGLTLLGKHSVPSAPVAEEKYLPAILYNTQFLQITILSTHR